MDKLLCKHILVFQFRHKSERGSEAWLIFKGTFERESYHNINYQKSFSFPPSNFPKINFKFPCKCLPSATKLEHTQTAHTVLASLPHRTWCFSANASMHPSIPLPVPRTGRVRRVVEEQLGEKARPCQAANNNKINSAEATTGLLCQVK